MAVKLHTIICGTQPGRVAFSCEVVPCFSHDAVLVDLANFDLPIYDEPEHPVRQHYQHEHTKKWAASVNAGDAYVQ